MTAAQLLNRAKEKGCFIECVCLSASIIDASLRIALILKHQIETQSSEFLEDLLYQGDSDKAISEREIYKRALNRNIIREDVFQRLEVLYKDRNRVVHRYIISEITTKDVLQIAARYEKLLLEISAETGELEKRQIELGVGMTRADRDVPVKLKQDFEQRLDGMIIEKHGDENLTNNLKH